MRDFGVTLDTRDRDHMAPIVIQIILTIFPDVVHRIDQLVGEAGPILFHVLLSGSLDVVGRVLGGGGFRAAPGLVQKAVAVLPAGLAAPRVVRPAPTLVR